MHVLDYGFGLNEELKPEELLEHAFQVVPKTDPSTARLIMLERYETYFGIHNHAVESPADQMPNMRMHDAENPSAKGCPGQLTELLKKYHEFKVLKYTGISFDRLIEFPREHINQMFKACGALVIADANNDAEIGEKLNKLMNTG